MGLSQPLVCQWIAGFQNIPPTWRSCSTDITSICANWQGFFCDSTNTSIQRIRIEDGGLIGSIRTEIGTFSDLMELTLTTNQIGGTLPTQLGQLPKLNLLDLSDNRLNGTLPTELGNILTLIELRLAFNNLEGSLPSLGDMPSLSVLDLSSNKFSGELSNLQYFKSLKDVRLRFNNFTGN